MTEAQAVSEANRCLGCVEAPCVKNCPAGVNVPEFIRRIATADFSGAYDSVFRNNPAGFICGKTCPAGKLCRSECNCGKLGGTVRISELQSFAVGKALEEGNLPRGEKTESNGMHVAVVGNGLFGIVCAYLLYEKGYSAVLLEASECPGKDALRYVPDDKPEKELFLREIELLLNGVEVRTGIQTAEDVPDLSRFDAFVSGEEDMPEWVSAAPGERMIRAESRAGDAPVFEVAAAKDAADRVDAFLKG